MRLVILGGAGAGKGTQSLRLSKHLQLPRLDSSAILRQAIADGTNLGLQAQPYVAKGELVPDELMIEFMREKLSQPQFSHGWVLDGYPRTAFQAEELDFLLEDWQQKVNWAIYLEVNENTMLDRSLKRGLFDDQPPFIQHRIRMFHQRTIPILEYYSHRDRLLTINGELSIDLVAAEIIQQLNISQPTF